MVTNLFLVITYKSVNAIISISIEITHELINQVIAKISLKKTVKIKGE